jgi:Mn2+/Fe2+ NRAMP family transporter
MNKIKTIIASILPGIFIIGYNVGTGSITSMSKAGANFGLDLLWAIALSCIITYYLILLFSRYTMQTGETFIEGVKQHIHPGLAVFLIAVLSMIILGALMGVLGIIAQVLFIWAETAFQKNISLKAWGILVACIIYLLLWFGRYSIFEKILAILVSAMGVAFISSMFIGFPSFSELASGFVPSIPKQAAGSDNGPTVIIAGMIGTTVSVFAFIIRTQIIKETGWKMKDKLIQRRDAAVSASMMFIISAAVIITAASTLHAQGLKMNSVVEMIALLEPIAGKRALGIFVIGIVAAGLSSHLPNLLVIPWLLIDYRSESRDTRKLKYRIMLLLLSIISLAGILLDIKPVYIMIISQACLTVVLPVSIGAIFYLTQNKSLMKQHANKLWDTLILSIITGFSLYMSIVGVRGLIADLAILTV